jgi:hypothetical protein
LEFSRLWARSSIRTVATLLTASSFAWTNQGSSTVTDQNGTIVLRAPAASGENCRIQTLSAPSPTYSVIAALQCAAAKEGVNNFGIGFRESSTGKFTVIAMNIDGSLGPFCVAVYHFTNATTFSSAAVSRTTTMLRQVPNLVQDYRQQHQPHVLHQRRWCELVQVARVGRTASMTGGPNKVLWYYQQPRQQHLEMLARLSHWSYALMTLPLREQHKNDATTTLNGAINNSVTSRSRDNRFGVPVHRKLSSHGGLRDHGLHSAVNEHVDRRSRAGRHIGRKP